MCALMASSGASAATEVSLTRGVLLVGGFRSQSDLNVMSGENQRNTLITELAGRTRDSGGYYQGLNDSDLAGAGGLLVYLRFVGSRTDEQIKTMSADDMRNTVIAEVAAQTHRGSDLQGLSNLQLIELVLSPERASIRGVVLFGRFRTQAELETMSGEDQRNTLITELAGRTRDSGGYYQGLNDSDLAGAGALLVYLRFVGSRSDAQIKTMSADDIRNIAIVEIHAQTQRSDLQALTNRQLALTLLGSRELPDMSGLPESQRPGQHTLVLRVDNSAVYMRVRSFSDVPFFGIFIGRNVDCTHGRDPGSRPPVSAGPDFTGIVGWGQIEGDGHPDSSSSACVAWVIRMALNFDVSPFMAIPVKTFDRAVLAYREQEAPSCYALAYTQGGYLIDSMPCWTTGRGARENKPNGCLAFKVPSEDWIRHPTGDRPVDWQDSPSARKIGASAWDVSDIFRARHIGGLGPNQSGYGYMLVGETLNVDEMTAEDNTRCTSVLSDVRLEVTYTVPPATEQHDNVPPR